MTGEKAPEPAPDLSSGAALPECQGGGPVAGVAFKGDIVVGRLFPVPASWLPWLDGRL